MSVKSTLVLAAVIAAAFGNPDSARAVDQSDVDQIVSRTCKIPASQDGWLNIQAIADGTSEWVAVDPNRLFFFASAQVGEIVSDTMAIRRVSAAYTRVNTNGNTFEDDDADFELVTLISSLQGDLAAAKNKAIRAYHRDGRPIDGNLYSQENLWLVGEDIVLRCKREKPEASTPGQAEPTIAQKSGKIDLRLRGAPEALPLEGEDRKTATAASIGFKRERVFLEDGTRKQTNSLSAKAVMGLAFQATDRESLFAYASYELERSRTRPPTSVVPPATIRDGDTEILKIGAFGHYFIDLDPTIRQDVSLTIGLDAAYLFDLVKNSERLRAKVIASPFVDAHVPYVCGIRRMRQTFVPGVLGRCDFDGLFELNHLTRAGLLTSKDEFVLAGGRVGYNLMFASHPNGGIFAGGTYELQKSLYGGVPDIERHRLYVKYRHWNADKFAVDIGIDLVDGINPDSFADENILQLSVGFLF